MTVAFVLGGAACVWDDFSKALDLAEPDVFVAVNEVGAKWHGSLDYWVTLHSEKFHTWSSMRRDHDYVSVFPMTAHGNGCECDVYYDHNRFGHCGSSGHFGALVALDLANADRVYLCGVPLTVDAGHIDGRSSWDDAEEFKYVWRESLPYFKGRVFSVSGWTRELLGTGKR